MDLVRVLNMNREIVDHPATDDLARWNEERYRTLFDLGPVAVYSCDASGVIQEFNFDAGRISGGKLVLRKERVELSSVVHHAVEAARPLCESLDQELTVTLPEVPVYLNADPTRLAQIVGNLLNNASKFSDRGGHIWLTVERIVASGADEQASRGQPPNVVIRVRDTGLGIAADQQSRVFEMFTQLSGHETHTAHDGVEAIDATTSCTRTWSCSILASHASMGTKRLEGFVNSTNTEASRCWWP